MSQQHPMTVRSEIASAAVRRAARRLGTLARFGRDRRGNVLVFTAIGIFALMGAAGLGTEVASWYAQKRAMQNAADLGADSGILVLKKSSSWNTSPTTTYATAEAKTAAAWHGYSDGSNSTTVTVNIPPASGGYRSAKAIEVIVQKPASLLFASLFLPSAPSVKVRAVAVAEASAGDCMLATHPGNQAKTLFSE